MKKKITFLLPICGFIFLIDYLYTYGCVKFKIDKIYAMPVMPENVINPDKFVTITHVDVDFRIYIKNITEDI